MAAKTQKQKNNNKKPRPSVWKTKGPEVGFLDGFNSNLTHSSQKEIIFTLECVGFGSGPLRLIITHKVPKVTCERPSKYTSKQLPTATANANCQVKGHCICVCWTPNPNPKAVPHCHALVRAANNALHCFFWKMQNAIDAIERAVSIASVAGVAIVRVQGVEAGTCT